MVSWIVPFYTITKFLKQSKKLFLSCCRRIWDWYLIHFLFHWMLSLFFQNCLCHNTIYSFVNSVSEKGFLCLPRTHATFIEASINLAVSLILQLFCWYNDLGMFIVIVTALLWPLFHCKSSPWSCASQGQHEHEFLSTLILKCFHFQPFFYCIG